MQVATCADIDMHGIDATIPAIEYTTIPANKGAKGTVSVRERAMNEAALASCVFRSCVSWCVCVTLSFYVRFFTESVPPSADCLCGATGVRTD